MLLVRLRHPSSRTGGGGRRVVVVGAGGLLDACATPRRLNPTCSASPWSCRGYGSGQKQALVALLGATDRREVRQAELHRRAARSPSSFQKDLGRVFDKGKQGVPGHTHPARGHQSSSEARAASSSRRRWLRRIPGGRLARNRAGRDAVRGGRSTRAIGPTATVDSITSVLTFRHQAALGRDLSADARPKPVAPRGRNLRARRRVSV